MQKFLIDANLPYHIDIWNSDQFIHVFQLNPEWDDNSIWNYAKQNDLIIVSKDKDFFIKQLLFGAPPKLIQIKYGNLKLKEFIQRIEHGISFTENRGSFTDHYLQRQNRNNKINGNH